MSKKKPTLSSATKQISLIKKQIRNNIVDLKKYSSMKKEDSIKADINKHKKEVKSLVQENEDLAAQFLALKLKIDQANANTMITMEDGNEYSISQLLSIKRELEKMINATFNALDTTKGRNVIKFYSEAERKKKLAKWKKLFDEIDVRMDEINVGTKLE